jgi:hypothetical protein
VPKTDGFGTGLLLAGAHYESLLPQLGALAGGSTIGLNQGQFGALGQLFASVRF